MINQKVEIESQHMIGADESVSSHQENRGKFESKKKMKKVRSMKLQRLSSRGRKPQNDHSSIIEMADASPNYMKSTSSSHAKDSFQIAERVTTNKSLTRVATWKLKRSLTRKSLRSIKLATVKGPNSTPMLCSDSESVHGSDDKNKNNTSDAGNKSQRVITRRLSLKPVRISSKKPSLLKATCSSTIKDSHFSDQIDLPQEVSGSQGVAAVKVCPYTYCSLHGHRHGDVPPLKRFVSMRRRQLKTQKSVKKDGRSKQTGNVRKATQKTKTVQIEDRDSDFQTAENLGTESSPSKPRDTLPSTVNEGDTSTRGKKMEADYEVLQKSFAQEEPKPGSTTSVGYGVQERDQKYIKKWHLMYKHAILSNTGKCENKVPFVEKDKKGIEEENALVFNGGNNSCQNYSETDLDMDDEKKNVIELVQKAFDEILLPDAEDLSSDDHSKSRVNETDEVPFEKSEDKIEERNATTSAEFPKEMQKMASKPKSWSHLKKVILLKRFVKALEKVRNINPRRPRQLPSDANYEAEKVFLNRQTAEERKKSEEWMLDYALQKVISKLAPVQRQKVTLLIEAFETIRPSQDAENVPRSTASVESQENPIDSLDASSNHSMEETKDGRDFEVTERARNDKNMTACMKNDESSTVESTSTDVVKFPIFNMGTLEEEVTTKGENMEPDHKVPQKNLVQEEPKHGASTTGVPYGVQEGDQKYIKKWHLMYKQAVLSNTGKCENELPFVGKDKKGREEDDVTFDGGRSSCRNYSETDSDMDDEKKNVIELVQKAFDEILLPEADSDLSSDDHSKSRSYGSEEVLLEKSEGKEEERNTTTFTESPKEAQKMENKPKSWSHLKKLILLKRFVKALDKVRNINPRRPRQLPSDANFEAEKVFLNRQTAEERKKSEEWMLDYALQKVISKLAPAQRQRVTLLIEAFETIRPFQDAEKGLQPSVTVESQENPIQSLDDSSNHRKEEINNGRDSVYSTKTLLGKVSCSNDSTMEVLDKSSGSPVPEVYSPINPVETINSCHKEAKTNRIVDEVPEDLASGLNRENRSIESESHGRCEAKKVIGDNSEQFSLPKSLILNGLVRSLKSKLVVPEEPSNQSDEPTSDRNDMMEKGQLETSEAPIGAVVESETQVEKQGNTGLWFMVYKHMVSDMTENNSKTSADVPDEKVLKSEGSITRESSVSDESTPVINQEMHLKDRIVADRDVELRQIEAIKMVEEAIDSILPDRQPFPDDNKIDRTERMYSESFNRKERKTKSGNEIAEEQKEESVSKEGNKPSQKLSRNWSNLKKVVLLRRFIKALEKVRKFNPRGPRYLPLEPDSEAEKVELRHQDMAERRGTEEWMLDYALRQVVSKLTPARKRKVELLVEAFETVVPTVKN